MMRNISKEARMLYRPTDEVIGLTLLIETLIEKQKKVTFPYGFNINGLLVNFIETDSFSRVLVHWYPNYQQSRRSDTYCSALVLTPIDLRRIYREAVRILHE